MKERDYEARIVFTSCLKLCPRTATSVAFVAGLASPRIVAIKSRAQLRDVLPLLIQQKSDQKSRRERVKSDS